MKKVWMFVAVVLAVSFALMVGKDISYAADQPIKWRCQTHWPLASASFKPSAVWMANEIKKRTNGRLIIELYNEGQLVPSKDIFTAVKRGMIEIGVSPPQYYSSFAPLAQVASGLPFNFREDWEAAYFYKWMGFEDMMQNEMAKHGIYYATDRVYANQLVSKKPIRTLNDFKGVKIRTAGALAQYFSLIGGAATYILGGEVYSALASGVIDGAFWGDMMGAESMGFFEPCKNLLWTGATVTGTETWLVNRKALNKLPKDIQDILFALFEEHFWKRTNEHTWELAHYLPIFKAKYGIKVHEISPAEYEKLQKAAIPIWQKTAALSPECAKAVEMILEFNKSVGRMTNVQLKKK